MSAKHPTIGYLGPAGTFTNQAAQVFAELPILAICPPAETGAENPAIAGSPPTGIATVPELLPFASVAEVFTALEQGEVDFGVVAIDNTVEGPVFAAIDGLLNSAQVVAVAETWLPIQFDAYALATTKPAEVGTAHPHALAQVSHTLKQLNLKPLAAASNGAALANLSSGQIAFGPPGYAHPGVVTVAQNVGDYPDAKTQFVLLAPRDARSQRPDQRAEATPPQQWATMLAITPGETGPGVLARITKQFAERGLNLSALFSRPIKGQAGRYVFIVTVDAAPWQPLMRALFTDLLAHHNAVKTLGVWQTTPSIDQHLGAATTGSSGIPAGSALGQDSAASLAQSLLW